MPLKKRTSRFKAAKKITDRIFKVWFDRQLLSIHMFKTNGVYAYNQRPIVFFDVDGTLSRGNLLLMFMHTLSLKNVLPPKKAKKLLRAQREFKNRRWRFDTYEQAVIDSVEELAGLPKWLFDHIADVMLDEFGATYYVITMTLLKKLQELGFRLYAVTGAPNFILPKYFDRIGLEVDGIFATDFIFEDNVFSGRVNIDILQDKGGFISAKQEDLNFDIKQSVFLGDTEGDISLMEVVGMPLGINPNQVLVKFCKENGIPFVVERKNLILLVDPKTDRVVF